MPDLVALLVHVALAVATVAAWLGAGALVLRPLGESGDRALDVLNRIAAGAVAFALATFAAGWAGLVHPAAYVAAFAPAAAAGVVYALPLLRSPPRPSFREWRRWELALGVLLALYVVIDVVATAAPISSADATFYHAAAPALFEQVGEIRETPWSWESYQPFTVEMLVLDGFLLWDFVQGAFAPLALGICSLAAVVAATRRLVGRGAALLAGAIFFANPFMVWQTTSTFVEPGLALTVVLAAWNGWEFLRTGATRFLVVAGVMAGGAGGMKYVGLAAGTAVGAAVASLAWRRVRPVHVVAYAVPFLLVAAPWYVKNWIVAGNPIYPLVFGGQDEAGRAAMRGIVEGYGHGHSAIDALLLPFRLVGDADEFDRGDFLTPLFLAFAPAALLDRRARRVVGVALAVIAAYLVIWFLGSQQARFLVPLMPVLAVAAAIGILELARRGRVGRVVAVAATAGSLAAGLAVSVVYAQQFTSVVVGAESEDAFLSDKSTHYDGARWLNENLPEDAVLLSGIRDVLYVGREYVVITHDVLPQDAPADKVRALMSEHDVTHVVLLQTDTRRREQFAPLGLRLVERVPVHTVVSRTLAERGPPDTMLVYAL